MEANCIASRILPYLDFVARGRGSLFLKHFPEHALCDISVAATICHQCAKLTS